MSNYYDVRGKTYNCECGWSGTGHDGGMELYDDLYVISCPKCGESLDTILYPTYEETIQASNDGKKVDPVDLHTHEIQNGRIDRWEKEKLINTDQLPDIQGEQLEFVWNRVGEGFTRYYTISHNGSVVWREIAFWQDGPRFPEIVEIFKQKYGSRYKEMGVTWETLDGLMGDKVGYWHYVTGCPIIETDGQKRWDLTLPHKPKKLE